MEIVRIPYQIGGIGWHNNRLKTCIYIQGPSQDTHCRGQRLIIREFFHINILNLPYLDIYLLILRFLILVS